jgi:SOS response associated peptidase (SRAP)
MRGHRALHAWPNAISHSNTELEEPAGVWTRTFATITRDANELVADVHDRMPAVLASARQCPLAGDEPDPRDAPIPGRPDAGVADLTRVNRARTRPLLELIMPATDAA